MESGRRLLFVSSSAERIGPTRSLLLLLRYLPSSWETGVVVPSEGPFAEEARGAGTRVHVLERGITKWSLPRLVRLVREEEWEFLYANTTDSTSRIALLAGGATGIPVACHVRAMGWGKRWSRLAHLRWTDAVVAVSEATARSVERFVRPERLHVVYNGVELPQVVEAADNRGRVRAELGSGEDEVLCVSVGNLCARKGQLETVQAFGRLTTPVSWRLVFLGRTDREPAYTARLRARIAELGLDRKVTVAGFRRDLVDVLAAADLCVHTAAADPHPRSIVEAMAAGLPVAAFATDGVAETVVHGRTGHLAPPGDVEALAAGLALLLEDPSVRSELGAAGRGRARDRFSAEATARGVQEVIEDVPRRMR